MKNIYHLKELPVWAESYATTPDVAHKAEETGESPYGWSNEKAPPAIGDIVDVKFNDFGVGRVSGYFVEAGWLGIYVVLDKRPDWHLKQNPDRDYVMAFGAEVSY